MRPEELQMLELAIPRDVFDKMLNQAADEAPMEACGILAGRCGRVGKLYKMKNSEHRCDHFMMEPKEQFAVAQDIRAASLEMLAVYHSHPATPARLSAEDIRLALTPEILYVIISLGGPGGPVVKGFALENGRIAEVPLRILEE